MADKKHNRPVIIAGNWKMYKTRTQAVDLAQEIVQAIDGKPNVPQITLFPPFTSIEYVATAVKGTGILVGAQNMNQNENGGFTGEISAEMVIDCGASVVLIGHSERRHIFNETNADVHAKLITALRHELVVVLCVGETLEQRESGKTDAVIQEQLASALEGAVFPDPNSIVIAYEPVWAIGTGKVCEPDEANRVASKIRDILKLTAGTYSFADQVPILYGGSVKPANVAAQLTQDNIDGTLVGGASLSAAEFVPIIEAGIQCYGNIR